MRMRFAKARLMVALLALFAWVGYVAYQAMAYGRFPVVSHAQLLISTLDVIAEITPDERGRPDTKVHVTEVLWPDSQRDLVGKDLVVANLAEANGFDRDGKDRKYLLPLIAGEHGTYRVAGLPRSPGFDYQAFFIYPDTTLTRKQFDKALKPRTAETSPGR
jgi:hypothetical protein